MVTPATQVVPSQQNRCRVADVLCLRVSTANPIDVVSNRTLSSALLFRERISPQLGLPRDKLVPANSLDSVLDSLRIVGLSVLASHSGFLLVSTDC